MTAQTTLGEGTPTSGFGRLFPSVLLGLLGVILTFGSLMTSERFDSSMEKSEYLAWEYRQVIRNDLRALGMVSLLSGSVLLGRIRSGRPSRALDSVVGCSIIVAIGLAGAGLLRSMAMSPSGANTINNLWLQGGAALMLFLAILVSAAGLVPAKTESPLVQPSDT